jgi:pathogenesis-related protein 1
MNRFNLAWIPALVLLAPAGLAGAQVSLRGPQSASGLPGTAVATSSGTTAGMPNAPAQSEPKSMAGMLAAQNDVRARLKLSLHAWSNDLAVTAEATVRTLSEGACSRTLANKSSGAGSASIYWAPGMRRLDGGGTAQDISPAFLVSEWREGRADYDPARRECRRAGNCEQYARMVAPGARAVGCAKAICPSQAQVWACHYSGVDAAPPPELRRLKAD